MEHQRKTFARLLVGVLLALFVVGCGGSTEEFVFTSNTQNGATIPPDYQNPPDPTGEAFLTLESTLEVDDDVMAQTIRRTVSTVRFTTFSSTGSTLFTSPPLPKSPQIRVSIPLGSTDVKIDYVDPTGQIQEIWGSPVPPLKLNEEFVIREPRPDSTLNVSRVVVEGPTVIPRGIPTQFRARVFYVGGASQLVTNSARWSVSSGTVTATGKVTAPASATSGALTVTASFGGRTSAGFVTQARNIETAGAPFFADETGQFFVNSLELGGFGGTAQMRLFSDFADGQRREVTSLATFSTSPANIITVNALGRITAVDAGTTTLTGLFRGRQGRAQISVGQDFFTTVFTNFQVLPGTISGLSPSFKLADFNLDGRLDIVGLPVSGGGVDFTRLAVHLGNGDGTFRAPSFISLPLAANTGATPVIEVLGRVNLKAILIGNSSQANAALVLPQRFTAARSLVLPAPPVDFFPYAISNDQLLVRTSDNRLTRFFTAVGVAEPLFSASDIVNLPELDADEFLDTAFFRGILQVVHYQRARTSGERSELRFLTGRNTLVVNTAFSSGAVTAGLPKPDASTFDAIATDGGDRYFPNNSGTVANQTIFTGPNTKLTAFEFGSARRILETLATGSGQPQLVDSGQRLDGFPAGTFDNFDSGDVTGDGTFDLVSWQNGVIRITKLAATN